VRYRSRKREAVYRERRVNEQALYDLTPFCARCGRTNLPLSGHELVNRGRGGDPAKPDMLLCDLCNTWCEDNPREAAEQGWKKPSASLRHAFTGDDTGFFCRVCSLPSLNWRHRGDAA